MEAYVVSPSVDGPNSAEQFIPFIKKHHVALMGWSCDDPNDTKHSGRVFHDIPMGSLIIIAYGENKAKKVVGAGFVDSESREINEDGIQCNQGRHLKCFCDLSDSRIPFSADCKFKKSPGIFIRACYPLEDNNPADKKVIDAVLSKIQKHKEDIQMNELSELLKNSHNLILTGAPGTGKTYLARQIARKVILGRSLEEINNTAEDYNQFFTFVQFHPSYDYTDFVEGLRPVYQDDGTIGFQRQDGIFKQFCKSALETDVIKDNFEEVYSKFQEEYINEESIVLFTATKQKKFNVEFNSALSCFAIPQTGYNTKIPIKKEWIKDYLRTGNSNHYYKPYLTAIGDHVRQKYGYEKTTVHENDKRSFVFIIDEINRGDIAKIFGELFYAIDPGYRGEKGRIKTQYSNLIEDGDIFKDGFFVPENVYIIGTMNDIDRNVESMDFAIRRRFTWRHVAPEDTQSAILAGLHDNKEEAKKRMDRLNGAIRETKLLGENFCIGAAYFTKIDNTEQKWNNLWKYHLAPLLEEYVRGLPNADELVTKKFKDAYDLKIRQDDDANIQG